MAAMAMIALDTTLLADFLLAYSGVCQDVTTLECDFVCFTKLNSAFSDQNWLKFKKILKKYGDFAQKLADCYINKMGHLFYKNWYVYGSAFKLCGGTSRSTSPPKPNFRDCTHSMGTYSCTCSHPSVCKQCTVT